MPATVVEPEDASAASSEELADVIASRTNPARPVLPLAAGGAPPLHVYATPAAQRLMSEGAVSIDQGTVDWLEREVSLGDVVYDVGAGIGEYVLIAAKRRGAIVVAFEPGYAAYGYLCDNVLLNGCEATVVPIALALAARDGLAETGSVRRTRELRSRC